MTRPPATSETLRQATNVLANRSGGNLIQSRSSPTRHARSPYLTSNSSQRRCLYPLFRSFFTFFPFFAFGFPLFGVLESRDRMRAGNDTRNQLGKSAGNQAGTEAVAKRERGRPREEKGVTDDDTEK
jgi:hypothetical protein